MKKLKFLATIIIFGLVNLNCLACSETNLFESEKNNSITWNDELPGVQEDLEEGDIKIENQKRQATMKKYILYRLLS